MIPVQDPYRNVKGSMVKGRYVPEIYKPLTYSIGSRLNVVEKRMLEERAVIAKTKGEPSKREVAKKNADGFKRVAESLKKVGDSVKEFNNTVSEAMRPHVSH